ncbi:UDP-4-amino-4,6-dideoxy-N-acetyl-beta-L-altrosamine N-acetyltransferase [Campylobacter fetus]|uniref:UDP-4-amino-4, 6-dideoxy-N-acetyl-beta-L-altrosamine N-acetyltransferase n=1 Tax=Campylobacter fetus TaxID=196 RepID=UPI00073ADACD|nr:UDP-4-amino-4,6-dideoxy-N-acetyl-beta-L-altrosamine N-acetyltransferase [Campylobacter fetus]ALV65596.1 UDP-4-amino-4,6-dideoxy-beta-L-AltNAc o-acetyltransferase [Campylobacter fetus subsp. testudinum Sp3]AVK81839.1 UDP-4-amino-4,6-dideoxy-N-acetyl-beta-L-altrosamine N-acetyltransferase [Campylobacter fetus subsp. testudinum]EAK0827511.1 UDP-4-amino-4,6-dideoxy-N-acetyl-beta-L-altrosamine N-acetyltransferase [Campylobacter fetus]OCR84810.1 acetyltransferase [Campylobacter fetus subsp. testud
MIWAKNFINLNNDEILAVFKARTDPQTTTFCIRNDFNFDEHLSFVRSLKLKNDKAYFMIYDDENFVGVVSFIDINLDQAEFGLYKTPNTKSMGKILMNQMVKLAYSLNLKTIKAKVLKHNLKAINLYKEFGFEIYCEDKEIFYIKRIID